MRIWHRYVGYFTAGIMAIYAISGIGLIFRDVHVLKKSSIVQKKIDAGLSEVALEKQVKLKGFKIKDTTENVVTFNEGPANSEGTYNRHTGALKYVGWENPLVLQKLMDLHKSKSKDSLSYLNVIFGICLLFFVISSFWMFKPKTKIFNKGLVIALLGFLFALIMVLW